MRPLAAVALLTLAVGLSAAARRDRPNDIKNCNVYPGGPHCSSSRSEDSGDVQNAERPCPEVDVSQCRSGRLTQCGRCQTCLVYLERHERCRFPWPTNAECGPQFVCYTRGFCDYPV